MKNKPSVSILAMVMLTLTVIVVIGIFTIAAVAYAGKPDQELASNLHKRLDAYYAQADLRLPNAGSLLQGTTYDLVVNDVDRDSLKAKDQITQLLAAYGSVPRDEKHLPDIKVWVVPGVTVSYGCTTTKLAMNDRYFVAKLHRVMLGIAQWHVDQLAAQPWSR